MKKPMTKKQLAARCQRLERENAKLNRRVATLHLIALESVRMARELAGLIPTPNYDYARGC